MKKLAVFVASLALLLGGFMSFNVAPVYASEGVLGTDDLGIGYASDTGLGSEDVRATIARIIRVAMGLLGIVAVVIILIGGFKWMTAGGNEEQVGEAKKWIFSGVIGLAIILSAYALASFIISQLVSATTGTGSGTGG
ncbi:MAG: pilin [Candidatus Magasanikbacteria bacterium]|nr:pilin [Candidatus Magasanikbacteria bacterium]